LTYSSLDCRAEYTVLIPPPKWDRRCSVETALSIMTPLVVAPRAEENGLLTLASSCTTSLLITATSSEMRFSCPNQLHQQPAPAAARERSQTGLPFALACSFTWASSTPT